MDDDAREPIHGSRSTSVDEKTLPAQIKIDETDDPQPNGGGPRLIASGYILCRPVDMDTYLGADVRLKRGDKIIAMGHFTELDLYITRRGEMGHYPDQDGYSLVRYYFHDREPVSTNGG